MRSDIYINKVFGNVKELNVHLRAKKKLFSSSKLYIFKTLRDLKL
jgi:hypothetical protein